MEKSYIDRLLELMEKEAQIYEDILKLSEKKTDVIVSGKVNELEGIVKLEQSMIFAMKKLESEREKIVDDIAAQLNIDSSQLKVSHLKEILDKYQAGKLEEKRDNLLNVIEKIKHVNGLNSKLIRNSLEYIEFSINLLTNAAVPGNIYSNSGKASGMEKRNVLDKKL